MVGNEDFMNAKGISGANFRAKGGEDDFHQLPSNKEATNASKEVKSNDEISKTRKYLAVLVLFLINLLNYMDRYTVAGVLLDIQNYFGVDNASTGLLQTVFIISYMIVAPVFGYFGDRYNRKVLMLIGMLIWSGCTLWASFVYNKANFSYFLALRGLVGIGEASYSTIAPTIIADLFVKTERTRMLSVFYFAVPVGSGLGYIVGSQAAKLGGSWHWALRVTPGLGLVTMVLMIFIIPNPRRGASETGAVVAATRGVDKNRTSYIEDLKYVFTNPSFIMVSIGSTFMAFVVGSLTLWGPGYVAYSQIIAGRLAPCTQDNCQYTQVSFIFGVITCVAGFTGVWIGAESSKKWKDYGNKDADAHVCAIGLIVAAPLLFGGIQSAVFSSSLAWTFIFFADLFLCFTWTLVGDMTLYVTLPMRRSTAQAVQILCMHLLGDAGSPYLIGVISDALAANMDDTYYTKFITLERAIYTTLFASVLGGASYLVASIYLQRDKKKVDDYLSSEESCSPSTSSVSLNHSPTKLDASFLPNSKLPFNSTTAKMPTNAKGLLFQDDIEEPKFNSTPQKNSHYGKSGFDGFVDDFDNDNSDTTPLLASQN